MQTQNQHRGKERMRNAGSKKTEKAIDLLLYNRACVLLIFNFLLMPWAAERRVTEVGYDRLLR